jgi:biotin carboxyl carrier protein
VESTADNEFTQRGTSTATDSGEDDTHSVTAHGSLWTEIGHHGVTKATPHSNLVDDDNVEDAPIATSVGPTMPIAMAAERSESKMTVSSESQGSSNLSGSGELVTSTSQKSSEAQTITNTGYDYHVPSIEAEAQNVRAQISLIDEQYAQFIDEQQLPSLKQIFANELKMIDLNLKKLQVAYLNTILLSPINGVVTGVFADAGDSVKAGQVLIRVENNTKVLLETTLVYRDSISVGDTVTVQTSLFSNPANSATISGTVVAARGDSDDDRWNIVVNCDNRDSNGQEILPLHYSFDHDDTSITIS